MSLRSVRHRPAAADNDALQRPAPGEGGAPAARAGPPGMKKLAWKEFKPGMSPKHQLNVHLDYGPQCFEPGGLEVRYGYHYSGEHQLREQVVRIPPATIAPELKTDLDALYEILRRKIPEPEVVRLPHAAIRPTIRPAGLTVVVLDQSRAAQLPIARLYYYEEVDPLRSRIERRVYLERPGWSAPELQVCDRVRETVRKLAWQDYSRLLEHHLFGPAEEGA